MLRRIALLVALIVPVAGLAQTSGQVLISPTTFGSADCTSTAKYVTLAWNSSVTVASGDTFRVYITTDSNCSTSAAPTGGTYLTGAPIDATTQPQTYVGTLTRQDFIADAGITNCTVNDVIYVCVQHWASGGTSAKSTVTGSATLEVEPPPFPVLVSVAPGDSALFVSWADGTKNPDGTTNTIAAVSYNVTAVASSPLNSADTHTKNFTSKANNRIDGLTNGVTYSVTVTSLSAGGNESVASSPPVLGTPQPVNGFWEQYTKDGGPEQGGCGGGPAGVVALLGVALALRGLRRRS